MLLVSLKVDEPPLGLVAVHSIAAPTALTELFISTGYQDDGAENDLAVLASKFFLCSRYWRSG